MGRSFLGPHKPSMVSVALRISMGLLVIDSIIELTFTSSTVAWLNNALTHKTFYFTTSGSRYHIAALPRHLLVDQVHTTVAAAVAALAVIGLGGIASLWVRHWAQYRTGWLAEGARYLYYLWLAFNLPALLLTGSALVYVFAVTKTQANQKIDIANAVDLKGGRYFQEIWTPQSWFSAVLRLKLLRDREEIVRHLMIIRGWQYNLIPSKSSGEPQAIVPIHYNPVYMLKLRCAFG